MWRSFTVAVSRCFGALHLALHTKNYYLIEDLSCLSLSGIACPEASNQTISPVAVPYLIYILSF